MMKMGAAAGAGSMIAGCGGVARTIAGTGGGCASITGIDTVVIFIQENRSFDHYFGSYKGVRGFNDRSAAFQQPYPGNTGNAPAGVLLPYHLDMSKTNAACTHDISHDWVPQHQSWNNGAMNGFVTSRIPINATDAVMTMGYYDRADLPYYYGVADAFTLCDNYFCPVIGPSDPNRLYTMAASLDPDGTHGGPLVETLVFQNRQPFFGKLTLTTMPEQLQARGISWKVYGSPDQNTVGGAFSDNILSYFKNFQDPSSTLYHNAFSPVFPTDFVSDAATGNLPQVSWILASLVDSDHPPAPATFGENTLSLVVQALMANPAAWAKTALFVTYDENGGFFDHVPPVTAPPGTAGEYVTVPSVPDAACGRRHKRSYRAWIPRAVHDCFAIQPRWTYFLGPVRPHIDSAFPGDTFRRGGPQPVRVAAPDCRRHDRRIQLLRSRLLDPESAFDHHRGAERADRVPEQPGRFRAVYLAISAADALAGGRNANASQRCLLTPRGELEVWRNAGS